MTTAKRMIFKAENLLVDVLGEMEIGGVKRFKVRDANNKKADIRTVLEYALREPTEEDIDHIVYTYTDDETGDVHTVKLQKEYLSAVPKHLRLGMGTAVTTKWILEQMDKPDTDASRRQFRGAVAYWIERGVVICSTSNGYFIAVEGSEVQKCVQNKERQAHANLKRAELLKGMDIEKSIHAFHQASTAAWAA